MFEKRKVILVKDGVEKEIEFRELKKGDIFKLFEENDGSPVLTEDGNDTFLCTTDAEPCSCCGIYFVEIDI